jgi:catechol 2,3-dioxygenase-like lactoylglutathione lyase family enzyme
MLDHVILTVSDLDRSVLFYRQALSFLNTDELIDFKGKRRPPRFEGIWKGRKPFLLAQSG